MRRSAELTHEMHIGVMSRSFQLDVASVKTETYINGDWCFPLHFAFPRLKVKNVCFQSICLKPMSVDAILDYALHHHAYRQIGL